MKRNTRILSIFVAALASACGGGTTVPCDDIGDCIAVEGSDGYLCIAGACERCSSDAQCAMADRYGAGAVCESGQCVAACTRGEAGCACATGGICDDGSACEDGRCPDEATGCEGCACNADDSCDADLDCEEGMCVRCERGTEDCQCMAGDTCDAGFTCNVDGLCEACSSGQLMCPCDAGRCDAPNTCDAGSGICVPSGCDPGAEGTTGCPCRNSGTECDTGVCRGGLCVECANNLEGCPCEADICSGLVCGTDDVCRAALTCDEITCAEHQDCDPSRANRDAACLPSCEPGWIWDGTSMTCVAFSTTNCSPGAEASILTMCEGRNRICVETSATEASCGDCAVGYRDVEGTCVAIVTCADLDCGAMNRLCVPPTSTTDATCGDCEPGFTETAGVCMSSGITCSDIGADCANQNRECDEGSGGASCGACVSGYVEDPDSGSCIVTPTCSSLDCASANRECDESGAFPVCGDCADNYIEDVGSGSCRPVVTCDDCPNPDLCTPGTSTTDASCRECGGIQTFDMHSGTCVNCPPACTDGVAGPGETGNIAGTVFRGSGVAGACICETRDDWYHTVTGGSGTFPCDADGDGWVRQTAREAVESTDAVLRSQARCVVHQIGSVILEDEHVGGRSHIESLSSPIYLYESLRNDDDAMLDAALPDYGGRRLMAREVNSMTKACVSSSADHNHNYVFDVQEYADYPLTVGSGGVPSALAPLYTEYTRFSYYVELMHGAFVPDDPTVYSSMPASGPMIVDGDYRITERSRTTSAASGGVPVTYDARDESHHQSCIRHRDVEFGTEPNAPGFDLASFTGGGTDSVMTHHSQYRCLQVVNDSTFGDRDPDVDRHMVRTSDLEPGQCSVTTTTACVSDADCPTTETCVAPSAWTVNQCGVTGGPIMTSGTPNPDEPVISCTASVTPPSLPFNTVVWGAVNYLHGSTPVAGDPLAASLACSVGTCPPGMTCVSGRCRGTIGQSCTVATVPDDCPSGMSCQNGLCTATGYVRGCIDECLEHDILAEQCPGIGAPGVACEANRSNFGEKQCGCRRNYGGADCSIGCPDAELMYQEPYAPSPRTGFWMCGHFAASDGTLLQTGSTGCDPTSPSGYCLRGEVPVSATDGTALESGSGCSGGSGFCLRAR